MRKHWPNCETDETDETSSLFIFLTSLWNLNLQVGTDYQSLKSLKSSSVVGKKQSKQKYCKNLKNLRIKNNNWK